MCNDKARGEIIMLNQKLLACVLVFSVPLTVFASDYCIGNLFDEGITIEGKTPPTVEIISDVYAPQLQPGESVVVSAQTQTDGGTPVLFWCLEENVGKLEAVSGDLSQVKYTAPHNVSTEQVLRLIARVADNQGYAGGDNMYLHLLPGSIQPLYGILKDTSGQTVSGARLSLDNQTVTTDASGEFGLSELGVIYTIDGISYGDYVLELYKDGQHFETVSFIVSENTAINGLVKLEIPTFPSALKLTSRADSWIFYQGESVTHTITAFNYGTEIATGVKVRYQVHPGMQVENTSYLDGVTCSQAGDQLICTLPDMQPNSHNMFKIKLLSGDVSGVIMSQFELYSDQYPVSIAQNWIAVRAYLSVRINATPNPVTPKSNLFYEVVAELSPYAELSGNLTATGILLDIYLPENVAFESLDDGGHATCSTADLPIIKCIINDLSIANAGDVSRAVINVRVTLQDPGLLLLMNQANIVADQFPLYSARSRTKVDVGDGTVDAAIVLDITGSMQSEINATVRAISQAIEALADSGASPLVALVVFKDEVWVKAITSDLNLIRRELSKLEAEGGAHCPEASVEAIDRVIPHVKPGGTIIFATDASPYPDSDIAGLGTKIKERDIRIISILSGDCSEGKAWNDLALEK
jgi:hypothetical protein